MVNNTTTEPDTMDRLPFWSHVLALILYIILFLMAVLGNAIALIILRTKQELRTLTHAFLTNLVVADLLLALLTPFEATSIFLRSYRFEDAGCKLQRSFLYFFYAASILTLSAISLERFVAICYQMKYDTFKAYKTKIIALIWILSFGIISPHVYLSEERDIDGETVCFQFYTRESDRVAFFWAYALPCFFLLYLLPLLLVSATYWKVAVQLKEMEVRLRKTSQVDLTATAQTRKEVLKMLLVVVILFVVQWTPFEIVEILATSPDHVMKVDPIGPVRVAVNMMAFSNAVLNPIVFGFMSKPFREGFKEAGLYLLKCKCFERCCNYNNFSLRTLSQRRKDKVASSSATCLSEFNNTTQCDIDWDSSFARLSNPISITENELPIRNDTDDKVDCVMDHKL